MGFGAGLAHRGAPGCQARRAPHPRGRGLGSRHVQEQGAEAPTPGHLAPGSWPSLQERGRPVGSLGSQDHRGPRTRCRCPGGGPGPSHRGPRGKGRRWPPGPLSGAAPCRQPGERVLVSACSQTQTRKTNAGALCTFHPLAVGSGFRFLYFLLPPWRVPIPGPAASREALPVPQDTGYPGPTGDGTPSGPRSIGTQRGTAPAAARGSRSVFRTRAHLGNTGGPLVWGRLLGVFTSGSTFCRCRRWPRPEGHAESTCGGPPVRAPSYLRTRPQGKALPT